MDHDENKEKPCLIGDKDRQGRSNLCCCYTMDEQGNYDNPCYMPVEGCCAITAAPD